MPHHLELKSGIRSGSTYIYELECIRGLAILLVFLFHSYGISAGNLPDKPNLFMSFIVSGNTGVTLFFVLSGFLLSQPWLKSILDERVPRPHIRTFYASRILRVVPLYYCAILFSVIVSGNWLAGASALAFGFVGFDIFPYSVVWWTLSTEVQFYLLLPLLFVLWSGGKPARIILLGLLALWLFLYLKYVIFNSSQDLDMPFLMTQSLFGRLPAFLAGILAGYVYLESTKRQNRWAEDNRFKIGTLVTCLVMLVLLASVLQTVATIGGSTAKRIWHIHHSYEAILWASLILILLLGNLPGKRLLMNWFMAITGKLSYSIYLNHVPILFFLIYPIRESLGHDQYRTSAWYYLLPVCAFIASMCLAYVTYRLIELPFLNIKHKLPG